MKMRRFIDRLQKFFGIEPPPSELELILRRALIKAREAEEQRLQ